MLCVGLNLPSSPGGTRMMPQGPYSSNTQPVSTTPVVASDSGMPAATSVTKSATGTTDQYQCSGSTLADQCQGTGLYDLQFHQIQDLLNQGQQQIRDQSGGTYQGPSVQYNGILDATDAQSLMILSQYGLGYFDVHATPQFLADNAAGIISSLQQFLNMPQGGWRAGVLNTGGTKSVPTYTCPDGSIVTDPNTCPVPATVSSYTCPDGSIVADPNACPATTTSSTPTTYVCSDGMQVTDMSQCPTIEATPPPSMTVPVAALSTPAKWGIAALGIGAGILAALAISR